ncbi:hypothetical protein GCM10025870_02110 [Agromyces marinus]|uniref:Tyr recombinase domain-containing protein n=1 Tax=Agromyces marinus TaxID=1389020 RepID=A0ABM8GXB7_9MICO|nr:hypothetical protein GCM10025870_02110 [Agromyces marinus]
MEASTACSQLRVGDDPTPNPIGRTDGVVRWQPPMGVASSDADDFFGHLRGVENRAHNTVRAYQSDVKLFLEFAGDPNYDWNERCGQWFGTVFTQVVTEFNKAKHSDESPDGEKRPFSPLELQEFFDLADLEPERILSAGRKGALAAWRDAVMFKTLYAWGLRHNEARNLILPDFSRNARMPAYGDWGVLRVRVGKAMKGAPPKQRTVLTIFDWSVELLDHWIRVGLPRFGVGRAAPLFPTDTGRMVDKGYLRKRFRSLVDELGFPPGLDIHSLRRSYATDLQGEHGFDTSFVQLQLGHEHASTTGIYTRLSPDYRTREMNRVLTETVERSGARLPERIQRRVHDEASDSLRVAHPGADGSDGDAQQSRPRRTTPRAWHHSVGITDLPHRCPGSRTDRFQGARCARGYLPRRGQRAGHLHGD